MNIINIGSIFNFLPPGHPLHPDHGTAYQNNLLFPPQVVLFIHGGAYLLCNTGTHRGMIYDLAAKAQCLVFAVNYRRPPEVDLEVSIDDSKQAYLYLTKGKIKLILMIANMCIYMCLTKGGRNNMIFES
jgi:acetyl esterase/lipase